MSGIVVKNLHKSFPPAFSLQIDELAVKEGEFFGIIGPSGCGKTTLLRIITGLTRPDRGKIYINGQEISHLPPEKRNIGLIFQEPRLFPHLTIEENIGFGLKIKNISLKKAKIDEMLDMVGLAGFNHRYPSSLSGGQKQRAALARALVLQPAALLMDEPFSALDPELREEMRQLIKKLQKEQKITTIFITHDREEAFTLFENMAVMQNGKILQTGRPVDIYHNPSCTEVAGFLGINNIFAGYAKEGCFHTPDFKIILNRDTKRDVSWLVLKPESLKVKNKKDTPFSLPARIEEVSFRAGFYYIKARTGNSLFNIVQQYQGETAWAPGEEVILEYNPEQVILL